MSVEEAGRRVDALVERWLRAVEADDEEARMALLPELAAAASEWLAALEASDA